MPAALKDTTHVDSGFFITVFEEEKKWDIYAQENGAASTCGAPCEPWLISQVLLRQQDIDISGG